MPGQLELNAFSQPARKTLALIKNTAPAGIPKEGFFGCFMKTFSQLETSKDTHKQDLLKHEEKNLCSGCIEICLPCSWQLMQHVLRWSYISARQGRTLVETPVLGSRSAPSSVFGLAHTRCFTSVSWFLLHFSNSQWNWILQASSLVPSQCSH